VNGCGPVPSGAGPSSFRQTDRQIWQTACSFRRADLRRSQRGVTRSTPRPRDHSTPIAGTPGARRLSMRLHLSLALAVQLVALVTAAAGPRGGGGGGGGGRLGQVTGGIDAATGAGRGASGGSSRDERTSEGELYRHRDDGEQVVVVAHDGTIVRRIPPRSRRTAGPARVDLFLGVQKVVESDQAYSLGLAVEDRWFRITGAVSEYREERMDGGRTAMTLPTLMFGGRISGDARTRAFLEGGVAIARTREDGVVGSNLTGPVAGIHLEHPLGGPSLVGDAHVMMFEAGIKAYSGRLGLRAGFLEVALRVLDFNVGPALYGPEVGLQF